MNSFSRPLHAGQSILRQDHGTEARHLLRAILRECTYLPDAEARIAIRKQVLHTFRATERKAKAFSSQNSSVSPSSKLSVQAREDEAQKIYNWLRKGYKGLRHLQRANEGELRPLAKVLHYTYGRGGRRRHELLRPVLAPDAVISNSTGLEELLRSSQANQEPAKWDLTTVPAPDVFDTPVIQGGNVEYRISAKYGRLKALLRSQSRTRLPDLNGRPNISIRSEVCKVPAKNIWGRSMPRRRAKNMVRKWYNVVLSRVLPPLPEHEWMHLRGKIDGTIKWEGSPQKRASPLMKPETLTTFDLEKFLRLIESPRMIQGPLRQDHVALPPIQTDNEDLRRVTSMMRSRFPNVLSSRWLASPKLRDETMQDILKDSIGAIRPLNKKLSKDRGHRITHRLMKRLWTQVFTVCPMLTKEEGSDDWKVIWGSGPKYLKAAPAMGAFLPLFSTATAPGSSSKSSEEEIPIS